MKVLGIFALTLCGVLAGVCQESSGTTKDFDELLKGSYKIHQIWKGFAFRRSATVEARSPGHNYRLRHTFEFDPDGPTRTVYEEMVEGKKPRTPREVITIDDNSYIRDIGRSTRWVTYRRGMSEASLGGAYVSSSKGAHAVRDYFVRDRFTISSKETDVKFLGVEYLDGADARVFRKTETLRGIRKSDGLPMQSVAVMKYWFSADGTMLRADTESNGNIGSENYYLRITSVWQKDPSINIENPYRGAKGRITR